MAYPIMISTRDLSPSAIMQTLHGNEGE
jgi:hypothetical protein